LTLPSVLYVDIIVGLVGQNEFIVVDVFGARRSRQCSDEDDHNFFHGLNIDEIVCFLVEIEHEK
jgi:hypothetical protein